MINVMMMVMIMVVVAMMNSGVHDDGGVGGVLVAKAVLVGGRL